MVRYLVMFSGLLAGAMALMVALLARSGYSLFAQDMRPMLLVCILVAAYVSWRISSTIRRRSALAKDHPAGQAGWKGGLFGSPGPAQRDRLARVAARRRRLIAEGRLEAPGGGTPGGQDPSGEPTDVAPSAPGEKPLRVPASASVREKMAARAERVRRAREEGRL